MSESILDSVDIVYIEPSEAEFGITESRLLTLDFKGTHYPCVQLHRSFPFTNPTMYIAVRDDDDSDKDQVREIGNEKKKEIGMIKNLDDFDEKTRSLLEKFLELRYFAPNITSVENIKEEYGYRYWTVKTDKGPCKFTTTLSRGTVQLLSSSDKVMIYDVDGNRFKIERFSEVESKLRKQIEMFL